MKHARHNKKCETWALFLGFMVMCFPDFTHWGRVTHTCVSITTIGSDNGLSPDRRQAIIWTNAGILLIRTQGTNFSDFLREIRAFSFKKMHLKMSSGKWRPSCLGLNVRTNTTLTPDDVHCMYASASRVIIGSGFVLSHYLNHPKILPTAIQTQQCGNTFPSWIKVYIFYTRLRLG